MRDLEVEIGLEVEGDLVKSDYCHKPNHDLSHCYRLVKDLNKLYSTTERNGNRDEDEQGRLQMLATIKNYFESRKDSTN